VPDEPDSTNEPDKLRAADVDREFVAERLRNALNEGRLTLTEYDERLGQAYSARTYGDLKALLADLPEVTPQNQSKVVPAGIQSPARTDVTSEHDHGRRWVAGVWSSWITVACILTVIWVLSGAHGNFWPGWPLGIWGAVLVASTVRGLAGGAHHQDLQRRAERDARRRAERDFRHMNRDNGTDSL
jgi:uncharacterized protein DUF1707